MKGCDAVRDKLFAAVVSKDGPLAGYANTALDMRDGKVVTETGKSAPLAGVFKAMQVGAIEEFVEFVAKGSSRKAKKKLHSAETEFHCGEEEDDSIKYAFCAEFDEVRINARTGKVRVPRFVGALAARRIVGALAARSQLISGMIWGIGHALHEID